MSSSLDTHGSLADDERTGMIDQIVGNVGHHVDRGTIYHIEEVRGFRSSQECRLRLQELNDATLRKVHGFMCPAQPSNA